jgi:hypothetical protein
MALKMASCTHDIVCPEQVDFIDDLMMLVAGGHHSASQWSNFGEAWFFAWTAAATLVSSLFNN